MAQQIPPPAAPGSPDTPGELAWKDYPLSPWAERYGQIGSQKFRNQNPSRSGYAPEYPSLHPKYQGETPVQGIITTNAEIDSLFFSEAIQWDKLIGLTSWQVATFHSELTLKGQAETPMPGGILNINDSEPVKTVLDMRFGADMIEPDESTWFRFLRKDRWFGPKIEGELFSPDREDIWSVLRISLDIANRTIRQLIKQKDPWIQTHLWGLIIRWNEWDPDQSPNESARLLLSPQNERELRHNQGMMNPTDLPDAPEDLCEYLEELLGELVWSFVEARLEAVWGYFTTFYQRPLICLTSAIIQSFLDGNITYAEKSLLIWMQSVTICHELMHAIMSRRIRKKIRISEKGELNESEKHNNTWEEPFINHEPIAECGESMENSIFGGRINAGPSGSPQESKASQGHIPMIVYKMPWISDYMIRCYLGNPRGLFQDMSRCAISPTSIFSIMPAAHAYKILSNKFWEDAGPKDFRLPDVFTSDHKQGSGFDPVKVNQKDPALGLYRDIANRHEARDSLWKKYRSSDTPGMPRLRTLFKTWRPSMWGNIGPRWAMELFRMHFNERDEFACRERADSMMSWMRAGQSETWPDADTEAGERPNWVYYSIGVLMMASLPIRKEGYQTPLSKIYEENYPCKEAQEAGLTAPLRIAYFPSRAASMKDVTFSLVINPLTAQFIPLDDRARQGMLDCVQYIVEWVGQRGCRMSRAWLREILSAHENLTQQAGQVRGLRRWVPRWPFNVPEYDGMEMVKYNPGVPWGAPFDVRYRKA